MTLWAALWRCNNREGRTRFVMWADGMPKLFRTRAAARKWIEETHGYIRRRADLRSEPHGWIMPLPVRVEITVKNLNSDK